MATEAIPRKPSKPEAAACGIGFLTSRKGVPERAVVDIALGLCRQFDHRGAAGHGAGLLLDVPWPLLLDRFPEHTRAIAQRDVSLGMFFLPFDTAQRRLCVDTVEDLAAEAGADVLGWADVPFNVEALPAGSSARRTAPVVRQALFRRPHGMGEDGWFASRYLLRLALDETLSESVGDDFAISSLSNRTVVYRGLAELSRVAELYPDLRDEHFASRFVLFHSRYSTNTTTAWRRAQPFWSLAHNGEIATIRGNVAWMHAIGGDLLRRVVELYPGLRRLASRVRSVVCAGGSDSANLDDMLIALLAGGLSLPQSLLALLPEAPSMLKREPTLSAFHEAMGVLLGACDGPAAIVACDGDEAVAHLDRNGLRPLWITTTRDYALAASELTGTADLGKVEMQRIFGPGDTAVVRLGTGEVLLTEDVRRVVAQQRFPAPTGRIEGRSCGGRVELPGEPGRLQVAFGMTKEDLEVVLAPLVSTGKLAIGSMGDDTPPAALLDGHPRRLDDHFKLRFAQETSPPIDPIRDAWVFETTVALGNRSGLWDEGGGTFYSFLERVLSAGELCWLGGQDNVASVDATFVADEGPAGPHFEVLRSEMTRLNTLMQDLLEYGKPGSHRFEPLPLADVVRVALGAVRAQADRAGVGLEADVPGDLLVPTDRGRLARVFQNLVENALQHAPQFTTVVVRAEASKGGKGGLVACVVEDSGPGFDNADLPRVFEPFFTRRRGGTGLGLSIVARIAEEHGGRVSAQNRPEGGARVRVELPQVSASPSGQDATPVM
jgi:glutamate synthase domain-containing protein 1